jgi:hypothetical protein
MSDTILLIAALITAAGIVVMLGGLLACAVRAEARCKAEGATFTVYGCQHVTP